MKKLLTSFVLLIGALAVKAQPTPAIHDIPRNDPGVKAGAFFEAEAKKKLSKKLSVSLGAEYRMENDFLYDKQFRGHAGVEYKLTKRVDLLGGYTFIGKIREGDRFSPRHRIFAGLKEEVRINKKVKFFFTEKLQFTHRNGSINKYQDAINHLDLKLMAKFQWAVHKKINLFTFGEIRTTFTEPRLKNLYYDDSIMQFTDESGSPVGDPGWYLKGYSKLSINRIRVGAGFDFKFNKQHKIRFTVLYDRDMELNIDANKEGTVIKHLVHDRRNMLYGRLGYFFSF